jgi:hydroxypyruvate reductase
MRGEHPETPKPKDPTFDRVRHTIIGDNNVAIDAAADALASIGVAGWEMKRGVTGEAADVGRSLVLAARKARGPLALIWGGETTVTVGASTGTGGRNQELALAAAIELEGVPNITVATFATDGVDGPTDAAGAIVTAETCRHARQLGLDPRAALANHDSHGLFSVLDRSGMPHLIRTGPTGTNVNDLAVALVT